MHLSYLLEELRTDELELELWNCVSGLASARSGGMNME